jgi:hypothetical protein
MNPRNKTIERYNYFGNPQNVGLCKKWYPTDLFSRDHPK